MTMYYIYLNKDFEIIASITEAPNMLLITSFETDTENMVFATQAFTKVVEAVLLQLDTNRLAIENAPGPQDHNIN